MTLDARFKNATTREILLDILADVVLMVNTMKIYLATNGPHRDQRLAEGLDNISRKCNEGREVLMVKKEIEDGTRSTT
jgi:hypothetical protein